MIQFEKIQRKGAKTQRTQRFLMLAVQALQVLDVTKTILIFLCVLRASAPLRWMLSFGHDYKQLTTSNSDKMRAKSVMAWCEKTQHKDAEEQRTQRFLRLAACESIGFSLRSLLLCVSALDFKMRRHA
ncbi:MAG: hypothetical protein L3J84_05190 [Gammaproteobacteria bacterium]|nr:hypothetical protein [Gammaproteobacteria bacterium]